MIEHESQVRHMGASREQMGAFPFTLRTWRQPWKSVAGPVLLSLHSWGCTKYNYTFNGSSSEFHW